MVQLTSVVVVGDQAEMAPPASYAPSYLMPLDQLPQTSLGGQTTVSLPMGVSSPQSPLLTQDVSSGHEALLTGSSGTFLNSQPSCLIPDAVSSYMSPDMVNSYINSQSTFSPIDALPVTILNSKSQNYPSSDLLSSGPGDVGKTFEVIPVMTEAGGYTAVVDNAHPAVLSFSGKGSLQDTPHMGSVDSLLESKGYSSDCSSDVYMNSDYTDTVSSADSSAFLLSAGSAHHTNTDSSESVHCKETSALIANIYSNEAYSEAHSGSEAFTEARSTLEAFSEEHSEKALMTWSSDEGMEEEKADQDSSCAAHCDVPSLWEMAIPEEEDCGAVADKEDDDDDEEEEEKKVLVPAAGAGEMTGDITLENLVNHLAEQHPLEVVDIRIEVLDQPMYSPVTEPLEPHWMQSTDSLHHYKLLKQGRVSQATPTSLRVHTALSNLRANTMNNLHERSSFLNLTAASVTNLGHACQKALSYVRADMEFGSMMSLGSNVLGKQQPGGFSAGDLGSPEKKKGGQGAVASGCHSRNVLYMALLVTLLLIAVNTTRNLQSSLNQEGGVGIICLAVMFASYTLGSLLSPVLVQRQGVKACVVAGLLLQLLYVAANLYPVLWLMLPASLGGGASLALIWNAMSTYIVLLARGEAEYRQKSYQRVSDKFFGIFCLIYQSNLIVGNLIASLVLTFAGGEDGSTPVVVNASSVNASSGMKNMDGSALTELAPVEEMFTGLLGLVLGQTNGTDNNTLPLDNGTSFLPFDATTDTHYHLCGSEYCHHFVFDQESSAVPLRTVYLLFGIFMFLVVGAILIALFLLEPLTSSSTASPSPNPWNNIKVQFVSLVRFSKNFKFLLILPLLLYSTMQFSFVCSEVMMGYITCPVGVWLVGYSMIGYGVSCSLGSYVTQALVPRIGRGCFIVLATGLNVGVLVFMRMWQPHPDSVLPLFVITGILGLTDGIWNVNSNGLCGSMFPDHYEEAFTGLRMAQGLGGAFSMAYAPFVCMAVKIYVMIGTAVVVLVGYIGAEVLIRRDSRREKSDLLFEKEVV